MSDVIEKRASQFLGGVGKRHKHEWIPNPGGAQCFRCGEKVFYKDYGKLSALRAQLATKDAQIARLREALEKKATLDAK